MKLARKLNVYEQDRWLTLFLGLTHFCVAAAHGLFDIASTSLLVGELGPDTLPQVYLGSAIVLIVAGIVVIPFVDRLDRVRLFASVLIVFSLVLFVAPPLAARAPAIVYRGLYIACYLMKSLIFLQFWLLAGDLLDIRQAKRLFPVLLGFSLVGGLVASITASVVPQWVATEGLLTLAGGLLVGGLVTVEMVRRKFRPRLRRTHDKRPAIADAWKGFRDNLDISLRSPLLRTLSLCLLLLAMLAQVLDFLMGKAAHVQYMTPSGVDLDGLTSFYAILNGVVIGAGAIVQFLLANRLLSSLGVIRGQWLAPVTFVGAFVATGAVWLAGGGEMATSFFVVVLASRAVQKVMRISLVRTSTDLIFNAIPSERRGRAKAFKETLIEPAGVLLGGLLLLAGTALPLQYVLGGSLLLAVLFLMLAAQLKDRYLESLVHVLREKSRFRFAFPSLVMRKSEPRKTPASVSALRRALANEETSVRLLAVEVAAELKEPEAASLLVERFREETDPEVRSGMLQALGKMVRNRHGGAEADSLGDLDPWARASGMESIAQSGIFGTEGKTDDVETQEEGSGRHDERPRPEPAPQAEAEGSPSVDRPQVEPASAKPLEQRGTEARRRFFLELARSRDRTALERLIHYLEDGDGATRHLAARALEEQGDAAVDLLTLALWSADVEGRRYAIRALGRIGTQRAHQALLPVLSLEAEEAFYDLVRVDILGKLPQDPSVLLLKDSIGQRVRRAKRNAHSILRWVFLGQPGMRLILSNLNHPDPYVRSSAIEALEVRVDPALLGGILPLFEHENPRMIAEHGSSLYELPVKRPLQVLEELTRHRSSWIRACAVYALGQVGNPALLPSIEARLGDSYELCCLNAIEALGHLGEPETVPALQRVAEHADSRTREYVARAITEILERSPGRAVPARE